MKDNIHGNNLHQQIETLPDEITKDDIDKIILPLIHKCIRIMNNVLKDSRIPQDKIKGIVLVGGPLECQL